ncbi:MAG: hypothetical protein LW595_06135, partial [Rickettsiales bacterium]|nr:hypothetical protein [Rickettsiales bacterium]
KITFHFNNHKVDWEFDSNEEAQKVFIYLQKKINADISQTKEFAEAIEEIKAKIIAIEPESTITVENKRIIVYMLRDSFIAYSNSIKNNITPLCEEIDYQLSIKSI